MADEQDEPKTETDSDGDEREEERTLEEIGDELLARLDEIDAKLAALEAERGGHHERISALEVAGTGYAASGHEHPYAGVEHQHEQAKEEVHEEKAPRSQHFWYRKWRG